MLHSLARAYKIPGGRIYTLFSTLADRPHLLIGGATGSGKSVVVNGIIYNLLSTRSPFDCQFILIDPKKVELIQYEPLPHTIRYASEPVDITRSLQLAVDITEDRFRSMQSVHVREYNGPHLYVIVDELADLMTMMKNETLPNLQRISAIGRAARVHLIACSQNILAQTIPTVLKCNIPTVVGLRTANKAQSRYLISAPGCELLPDPKREGKGYGFIRDGADLEKQYIHKYSDDEINSLVNYWTSSACVAV